MRPVILMKWLLLLSVILIAGCVEDSSLFTPRIISTANSPEDAVRLYFESWNNKDWRGMYNLISDGFKKIEPTAANYSAFEKFLDASAVKSVKIQLINVTSNDGTTANIDYIVIYNMSNTTAKSESNFIVKFKPNDKPPGWKMIQPYGEKADES
jgi:hypothetical protein